ncbi:DNA repair protein XRCC3 homolog [Salvia miltiorrhiza]|uniref:DNA repair protein XRCC3 homolog n=1 Tax=Salvia miltiorrhiza TaxID=226208 RepID=UPI0025ACD632|nr:DNA repair protein XRCC3 homolog [Salvia miltiorrhiza]
MNLQTPLNVLCTKKITFGCPILDRVFGGGIPICSITELVGEGGTGKTQLMLQLALNTQLPEALGGQSGNSLYPNSELSFPIRRLNEIASNNPFLEDNPLDKVFVHSLGSFDELLSIVARVEPFLSNNNVKLIIVDSVTTLFRTEFSNNGADMSRRQQMFFKIAGKFKMFASKYDLVVVMTNQVVDCISGSSNESIGNIETLRSSERNVIPALGLSWANCVNTRLMILKSNKINCEDGKSEASTSTKCSKTSRTLVVIFAPHLGPANCDIEINSDGVFGFNSS